MSRAKKLNASILSCYLLMYVVIWMISPPLFVNSIARLTALFSMLMIVFSELWTKKIPVKYLLVLLCYLVYTCVIGIYNQGSLYITLNTQKFLFLGLAFICAVNVTSFENGNDRYHLTKIFTAVLCIYPVWMIITLRTYAIEPYISRALAGSRIVDEYYWSMKGVGGYGMIYSLVFYNIILLYLIINFRKRSFSFRSVLILLNYLLSLLVLFKAGYSIAILSVIFGSVLLLLVKSNRISSMVRVVILILAVILVYLVFQDNIKDFFISITRNTLYENKVRDVIDSIQVNNSSGSLEKRLTLYAYSLKAFREHILFGTGIRGDMASGGHSFLLDTFALFGLAGGLPLLYLIFYYNIRCLRQNRVLTLSFSILMITFFIGMTNTVPAAMGPIIFVIYPYVVNTSMKLNEAAAVSDKLGMDKIV